LECGSELAIEDRVDDRIQRRVTVAEPEDDGEQLIGDGDAEQQRYRVYGEERQPAADERRHHDAEHERSAPLPGASHVSLPALLLVDRRLAIINKLGFGRRSAATTMCDAGDLDCKHRTRIAGRRGGGGGVVAYYGRGFFENSRGSRSVGDVLRQRADDDVILLVDNGQVIGDVAGAFVRTRPIDGCRHRGNRFEAIAGRLRSDGGRSDVCCRAEQTTTRRRQRQRERSIIFRLRVFLLSRNDRFALRRRHCRSIVAERPSFRYLTACGATDTSPGP